MYQKYPLLLFLNDIHMSLSVKMLKEKMGMGRKSVYDYIRVIACICVIGIHCTVALLSDVGSVDTKITAILQSVCSLTKNADLKK